MIATIIQAQHWLPMRRFSALSVIAELVLDGALCPGDLVDVGGVTYRILEGHVLCPIGPGQHLRAVEVGRKDVARLVPMSQREADVVEFLETRRQQAAAWAQSKHPVGQCADVGAYWDREDL